MARLIDADNIISVCEILSEKGNNPHYWGQLISIIKDMPTIDAIPVVHGAWINMPKSEWEQKACSVCGDYFCCQGNYCPNCGAKMDGERRDENAAD